jgi:serine protease AprX
MALVHPVLRRAVLMGALVVCVASPAVAARQARLSADLQGHLATGSPTIDVIVHGTRAEVASLAARYNVRIARQLRSGAVLRVSAGQLAALSEDQLVDHLSGNARFRATALTAESIGADQVWAGTRARSLTGAGVTVAVIDSGIDPRHSALRKRVLATVDFTGGNGQDQYGHGTHVAAIIAGQAGTLAETADYRGIAPGAFIVNLRVLGADGSGYASDVIDAIDWAIEHRRAYNIKVINLSLGTPVLQSYRDDPVCEAVERALEAGLAVVVAAGNHGRTAEGKRIYGGVLSPGNHPRAITVGAVDTHGTAVRSDDTVASYSSRGPTAFDLALKPDLVAPGSHIVSAEAEGSYLATTYAHRHVAGAGDGAFMQLSGTSMATGVVSGAVALLLEQSKRLSPREVKAVLQMTGSFMPGEGLMASGAGSLNVLAATAFVAEGRAGGLPSTSIGGEEVFAAGLAYTTRVFAQQGSRWASSSTISSGWTRPQSIFWGTGGDSIFWGTGQLD